MTRFPLKHLTLREIVESWDFWLAVTATAGSFFLYWLWPPAVSGKAAAASAYGGLLAAYVGLAGGLFSVNLAVYAVFTALVDPKLVVFLKRIKAMGGYQDTFLMTAMVALITLGMSVTLWMVFSAPVTWSWTPFVKSALHALVFGAVVYSLGSAALLVQTITDFFAKRSEFYELTLGRGEAYVDEYLEELDAENERRQLEAEDVTKAVS